MDYKDLKSLTNRLNKADKMINENFNEKKFIESQKLAIKNARRSLVYTSDLNENTIIKMEHITPKRPGTGVPVSEINKFIGKKLKNNVREDEQLNFTDF